MQAPRQWYLYFMGDNCVSLVEVASCILGKFLKCEIRNSRSVNYVKRCILRQQQHGFSFCKSFTINQYIAYG